MQHEVRNKKKSVKIGFCGFWRGFDPRDNFFTNSLKDYYDIILSDDPDYLFCSVFSNSFVYNEKAVRILFSGEYQTPDFNLFDYAMGFDHISFGDRYCRVPLYLIYDRQLLEKAQKRGGMTDAPVYRDKFCSFVYSNGNADPVRERMFMALDSLKHVDSGGRLLNNTGYIVKDKLQFEENYRFSIAFENASYPGYMTEKVIQAFAAGTIPIYWGDTDADRVLNKKAYINVKDYGSMEDAAEAIAEIDADRERFINILTERPFVSSDMLFVQREECIKFMRHIFDMPIDEAYRRNMSMRGRNYAAFFKRYSRLNETLRRIKDLFRNAR